MPVARRCPEVFEDAALVGWEVGTKQRVVHRDVRALALDPKAARIRERRERCLCGARLRLRDLFAVRAKERLDRCHVTPLRHSNVRERQRFAELGENPGVASLGAALVGERLVGRVQRRLRERIAHEPARDPRRHDGARPSLQPHPRTHRPDPRSRGRGVRCRDVAVESARSATGPLGLPRGAPDERSDQRHRQPKARVVPHASTSDPFTQTTCRSAPDDEFDRRRPRELGQPRSRPRAAVATLNRSNPSMGRTALTRVTPIGVQRRP